MLPLNILCKYSKTCNLNKLLSDDTYLKINLNSIYLFQLFFLVYQIYHFFGISVSTRMNEPLNICYGKKQFKIFKSRSLFYRYEVKWIRSLIYRRNDNNNIFFNKWNFTWIKGREKRLRHIVTIEKSFNDFFSTTRIEWKIIPNNTFPNLQFVS